MSAAIIERSGAVGRTGAAGLRVSMSDDWREDEAGIPFSWPGTFSADNLVSELIADMRDMKGRVVS